MSYLEHLTVKMYHLRHNTYISIWRISLLWNNMNKNELTIWNSHINDLYRLGFWDGCNYELYTKLKEHINGLKQILIEIENNEQTLKQ